MSSNMRPMKTSGELCDGFLCPFGIGFIHAGKDIKRSAA